MQIRNKSWEDLFQYSLQINKKFLTNIEKADDDWFSEFKKGHPVLQLLELTVARKDLRQPKLNDFFQLLGSN